MRFKFIGRYTNDHTSVSANGVTFEGHDPTEVPDVLVEKFQRHPEYEQVEEAAPPKAPATRKNRAK
jgi:hypothetical protein